MNNLPDPIIDTIYKYKHQLEYKYVMNELTNNVETMSLSRRNFIKYLEDNINEIEFVMLNNRRRMSVLDYLKIICKCRNKIFI